MNIISFESYCLVIKYGILENISFELNIYELIFLKIFKNFI